VQDQYPVMRLSDGGYYTMSLRMMKAVWRSVRLRRGFVNVERAPFGGEKLRIPTLLFVEKMRTQSRFNVSSARASQFQLGNAFLNSNGFVLKRGEMVGQLMRSTASSSDDAQLLLRRKVTHNASSKVAVVVERMLLPLLDVPLRPHVVFDALDVEDHGELDLVDEVERRYPGTVTSGGTFLERMSGIYARYCSFYQYELAPLAESAEQLA
jgi:hypothetical protein